MANKVYIVEDNQINIDLFKAVLSEFELVIFDNFDDALSYINNEGFKNIELAILDVNLGMGLKISGFHIAYRIIKNYPQIPIVICTAYGDDIKIKQKADIIGASVVLKPIKKNFADTIKSLISQKAKLSVSSLEQDLREFITGSQFLKSMISSDTSIPVEYMNKIIKLEETENKILRKLNDILDERAKKFIDFTVSIKEMKDDLTSYIRKFIDLVESTIYNEMNLPADEMQLVTDILNVGEIILEKLKKL